MKRFALVLPLICLAACNNEDVDMKNASPEEVEAEMREQGAGDSSSTPASGSRRSR